MRAPAETWALILAGGEGLRLHQETLPEQARRRAAILAVPGVAWSDSGGFERVLRTLAVLGIEPAWTTGPAAVAGGS